MSNISTLIQEWYDINKRDLPWRHTHNPYIIWLSEIILQQTQVVQGTAYFNKFVAEYPTVEKLASSTQEHVLKNWQGLGYYSRARNLHFAAHQVMTEYNGAFPETYHEIIKLKGVGEYTAAAIASFAYNEPYAVVDGNVFRLLSRLFAVSTAINSSEGKKEFSILAQSILDHKNPGNHNQAMMEVGALVCRPKNPKCEVCPLNYNCEAFKQKSMSEFPVKNKKQKVKNRFLNYIIITNGTELLINKREGAGIWQGLYDFPLVESESEVDCIEKIDDIVIENAMFDIELKHILTHQHLYVKFWIKKESDLTLFSKYKAIGKREIEDYPLPQLIVRYIGKSKFFKR